jgi:hypothetical protein
MVFQIAREIIANNNKGQFWGTFKSSPKIIAMEPKVSATDRPCNLYNTERLSKRCAVPQNQKKTPIAMQI